METSSYCLLIRYISRCVLVFRALRYKHRNIEDVRQHCRISAYRLELKSVSLLLPATLDASIRGVPASSSKLRDGSRIL